ncbi:MAG: hypothetical protein WA824_03415 [Candidatus Sulfotelmatobacter sp.]
MPLLLQIMRDRNRRIGLCLDTVAAKPARETITPEEMSGLLSELLAAGAGLRSQPLPPKETIRNSIANLPNIAAR